MTKTRIHFVDSDHLSNSIIHACTCTEVTQIHRKLEVNTVAPINISRCQHRTGHFSGCAHVMIENIDSHKFEVLHRM